jgi:steroid delta-isomerase-like uncharacterized protein
MVSKSFGSKGAPMPETTPDQNIAAVRRWFEEVWNQKKTATIFELFASDGITHGTQELGGDVLGPQGFLEFQSRFVDAFPDIQIDVLDCFAAGDKVAVRWLATGHHTGHGLGIEPSGAAINVGGMAIARFAQGKVVEAWDNYDKQAMFQQIAAKSASASA